MPGPYKIPDVSRVKYAEPLGPRVELFGHLKLVQADTTVGYPDFYAAITLRDTPGKVIGVLTSEQRLQSLLQTAFITGNLISFNAQEFTSNSNTETDLYRLNSVTLYSDK